MKKAFPQCNPDDYGAIREVVSRRFGPRSDPESFPELLLIDGGRGL